MSHLTFHRLSLFFFFFFFSRRRRGRDKDISGEPVAPKREESCNYRFSINNLVTSSIIFFQGDVTGQRLLKSSFLLSPCVFSWHTDLKKEIQLCAKKT